MKMYGIRDKATGEIIELFDDFFKARSSLKNNTQEVVERMIENDYKLFTDGRSYIIGTHSTWLPIEIRSVI